MVNFKKIFPLVLILTLSLLSLLNSNAAESDKTIKIGGAFALTGAAQSWGNGELKGAMLAVEEFNRSGGVDGTPVEIIVEDTQSTNAKTLGAVSKLVSAKNINIIIGATWLDSYSSPLPFTKQKKVLLITPSAGIEVFKDNPHFHELVFTTWYSTTREIDELISYMKSNNIRKTCSIFDLDPFFQMMKEYYSRKTAEEGIIDYPEDSPPVENADYKSLLLKIGKKDCQVIITGIAGDVACNTFYKQAKELNLSQQLYGFHDLEAYFNNPNFGTILNDMIYVRPVIVDKQFRQKYHDRYGENPEISSSNGYDAAKIIFQALKAGKKSPQQIAEYLRTNSFDTVTFGKTSFNPKGSLAAGKFEILKIVDGKSVAVAR